MSQVMIGRPNWTWDSALSGVIPPLISPLTRSRKPDDAAQARLVDHVIDAGCSGLFVLGGCGEGAWLARRERGRIIRGAAQAAAGRVPVLAGVMLPATAPAADAARQAEAEGADAIVVGSPYYGEFDAGAQERHVARILGAVALPVLLYNIPPATHNCIDPAAAGRLARDPRVLGIKDSSGDLRQFQRFVAIKERDPGFRVLQGQEHCGAASLLLGGDGLVPGMANFAPGLYVELVAAARSGDLERCRQLQGRISDLWSIHTQTHWLVALKTACALAGLDSGMPTAPLQPASVSVRRAVEGILVRHGFGPGR